MAGDEPKLLGDLPRRRPGSRSSKRPVRAPAGPSEPPPRPEPQLPTAGEVATVPLRVAVAATEAGLVTASRLTRELIRRLPRL